MDDATQKLVDEWERAVSSESLRRADALIRVVGAGGRMRDALEAAQHRAEQDHAEANRLVNEYAVKAGNLALALEAAQRPPVGPEVREEVRAVVGEQLTKAGLDLNGPPYSDDGETQWPVALELRDRLTDALLARFSLPLRPPVSPEAVSALKKEVWTEYRDRVLLPLDPYSDEWPSRYEVFYAALDALLARFSLPSQPVYDEEKIARWLHETPGLDWLATTPQELASALVAALRGGELTREERNE